MIVLMTVSNKNLLLTIIHSLICSWLLILGHSISDVCSIMTENELLHLVFLSVVMSVLMCWLQRMCRRVFIWTISW